MMGLSKAETEEYLGRLPVGFEFVPTDAELINDYLLKKFVHGVPLAFDAFPFINILDYTPDQLQQSYFPSNSHNGDQWYFFSKREYKHEKSKVQVLRQLTNNLGFWKKQSKHTVVTLHNDESLGTKNILDFYSFENSESNKTGWMMHEFIAPNHDNLISLYKIFLSGPASKRKREEEAASRRQQKKAAGTTKDDQAALPVQEELHAGSTIVNGQHSQDQTPTLPGPSQQQVEALPQDQQYFDHSTIEMNNIGSQRLSDHENVTTTIPSQLEQQLISNYDVDPQLTMMIHQEQQRHEPMGAFAETDQTSIMTEEEWYSFIEELDSLLNHGGQQPAQMHQGQAPHLPNYVRNPPKTEYIDVEEYFGNMTISNPQHD